MQSKLQEAKEIWGPAAIALGLTALSNSVIASLTPINGGINLLTWWINLVFGLVGILYGICAVCTAPPRDRQRRSRGSIIGITAGFSIFFVGTRILPTPPYQICGGIIIALALITMGLGFYFFYRRR